jgi:hypothetical protein
MMLALPVTTSNLYDREMILLNVIKSNKRSSSLNNKFYRTCRDANKEKAEAFASKPAVIENREARK